MAEETKQVAMIDPATIALIGIQVFSIISKMMSPNYVPPTVEQLKEMLAKLEADPDLEIYTPPGFFQKLADKIGLT